MKKKRKILLAVALGIVTLFAGGLILCPFQAGTGIYVAAASPVILFDNGSGEPVAMLPPKGKAGMFSGLETGDRILVVHNGTMMLSYPAQMSVFFCIRLKRGDVSNIPEGVMESLEEMGWLQGGTIGQN